jgi:hypothetical protein
VANLVFALGVLGEHQVRAYKKLLFDWEML